jgi:hypothetical protein
LLELLDGFSKILFAFSVSLWFFGDVQQISAHSGKYEGSIAAEYAEDVVISGGVVV